jgi:hypothetical protein
LDNEPRLDSDDAAVLAEFVFDDTAGSPTVSAVPAREFLWIRRRHLVYALAAAALLLVIALVVPLAVLLPPDTRNSKNETLIVTPEYIWEPLGQQINGTARDDASGYSVSLARQGDFVAIGAPAKRDDRRGIVRVFYLQNENIWKQRGQDILGEAKDYCGYSVALSYDAKVLAIGCPSHSSSNGNYSGTTRIFEWNQSSWQRIEKIDGEAARDSSGGRISLSGNGKMVAIGACNNDGPNNTAANSGHVRVFERREERPWELVGEFDAEPSDTGPYSTGRGNCVSALSSDGTVLVVANHHKTTMNGLDTGAVRVYERFVTRPFWRPIGQELIGKLRNEWFGWTVSLSANGKTVAVSGRADNGAIRVYERTVSDAWRQVGTDILGKVVMEDGLPRNVALSADGKVVAVGTPFDDNAGTDAGIVHVYRYEQSENSWVPMGEVLRGHRGRDNFGSSVSLSNDGSILAVGATSAIVDGRTNAGYVQIYKAVAQK